MEIGTARIGTEQDLPQIVVACQIGLTRIGSRGQARNGSGKWVDVRNLVELQPEAATEAVAPARRANPISLIVRLVSVVTMLIVTGLRLVPRAYALVLLNIRAKNVAECVLSLSNKIDVPLRRAVDTARGRC